MFIRTKVPCRQSTMPFYRSDAQIIDHTFQNPVQIENNNSTIQTTRDEYTCYKICRIIFNSRSIAVTSFQTKGLVYYYQEYIRGEELATVSALRVVIG